MEGQVTTLQQAGVSGLRFFQIVGDAFEPELKSRDFLMVAPASRFVYDGDYLLDFGDGDEAFRAQRQMGGILIGRGNPAYSRTLMTLEEFNQMVRAIVVADVKVRDRELIESAYSDRGPA
jgi:hypothetical protein